MNKPYIKLYHVIIEIISYVVLIIAIIFATIFVINTDGQIPTHYDFNGEITGYGSPAVLLFLPLSMLATNIILSLVMHFLPSSMMNIPVKIKPGNEIKVYSDCILMVALIELILAAFTLIETIAIANSWGSSIPSIIMVVAMFAIIIGCIIKMYVDNK